MMAFWALLLVGMERDWYNTRAVPVTWLTTVDLHSGFNSMSSGGLRNYYSILIFETPPELMFGSILVLAFEGIVIVTLLAGPSEG